MIKTQLHSESFIRTARRAHVAVIAFATLLASCSKDAAHHIDSTVAAVTPPPTGPPRLQAGDPGCPSDGKWKQCDLFDRLTRAGVGPKMANETTHVAFLTQPGIHFKVGGRGLLIAFFYPDTLALARALSSIDTLRLAPLGDSVLPWPSTPAVIRSANVVAAFFGTSQTQVERVSLAITAGPPQPPGSVR